MHGNKLVNWMIFIFLAIIWGSSFILMKVSTEDLTGIQIASVRIFSSGLIFFPFALVHLASIPIRKLHLVLLTGLAGNLAPAYLFAMSLEKVNSSLAGILNSLTPLFVVLIAVVFFGDLIRKKQIAGILIGFIGLVMLSVSGGSLRVTHAGPVLMILVATILYGINVNIVSHFLRGLEPLKMATISLSFASIPAGIVAWHHNTFFIARNEPSAHFALGASMLLGIVGTGISTVLFYLLIKRAGAVFASLVTYAIPVVALLWGVWAREEITLVQIGCLGIILGGVYLANKNS